MRLYPLLGVDASVTTSRRRFRSRSSFDWGIGTSMLDVARLYLFVFAALTMAGGILGFVRAKSRASLIAGSLSAILLAAAGFWMSTSEKGGATLGLVVSLALALRFGNAYRTGRKMMPAGLMTLLGAFGVALTAIALGG